MRTLALLGYLLIAFLDTAQAQQNNQYKPGNIRHRLEKLNVLGSVLYVAAHPDDENTRLIAYYANDKRVRTAYLSATRGDGGQNLIGSQIREQLGLIRTQELLEARRIDGGEQFFSRANDFGYSKNPDETFTIWDKEQVLADFVWIYRRFRPDVVITRFSDEGRTHGHHTASAILAREAFKIAGDREAFPEQLDWVKPWKPKKIFWNTGWWWFRSTGMDTTGLKTLNVGGYNPLLGASYPEVAARSRSMHKSQGFGASGSRGDQVEYLKQWEGLAGEDPFDGIDTSWGRVEGAEDVAFFINKAITEYDETNPSAILGPLLGARKSLKKIDNEFWKSIKKQEIDELIKEVTGLYISLAATSNYYTPGDSISINMEVVNRSPVEMTLEQVQFTTGPNPVSFGVSLIFNKPFTSEMKFVVPYGTPYTHPYWLKESGSLGMYTVADQLMVGKPASDPALVGTVTFQIEGEQISYNLPVSFRRTDPVDGEVIEPLSIGPPVCINVSEGVLIFGDQTPKSVDVRVFAGRKHSKGKVSLEVPEGWSVSPAYQAFDIENKNEEQVFTFDIAPPEDASEGYVIGHAEIGDKSYSKSISIIDYDHIPKQTLYPEAKVKVVRVEMNKRGNLIGYIEGAGDAIPENLAQIGYEVVMLEKDDINLENLSRYDAIILGVRAFNTVDWLAFKNRELFEYVKEGGNLIVQYNTSHRLVTQEIAPYDLKLSRDRVTVEEAPVEIIKADHPVMNVPNRITEKDFEQWVQERGLYFPNEWSEAFTPILKCNDPGESPKLGGLLVAKYGKGYYVYSGYSWFRELPAGVPGAYRIFVNMISLGK